MTTGHLINGVGVETCFLMVAEDFSIQNRKTKKKKRKKLTKLFQRFVCGDESYTRTSNSLVVELLTQNLGDRVQSDTGANVISGEYPHNG